MDAARTCSPACAGADVRLATRPRMTMPHFWPFASRVVSPRPEANTMPTVVPRPSGRPLRCLEAGSDPDPLAG
jgi:hypothetical protein